MLELSYETLHEMVRKQTMAARNQRENLQQTIRKRTYKQNKLENYNKNEHKWLYLLFGWKWATMP